MTTSTPVPSREERRTWYPIVLRRLEVLDVVEVTPRMRRLVLGGEQLGAFSAAGFELTPFRTGGFDDHVKLFLPEPGSDHVVLPTQDDGHLDWPHDGLQPLHRDYTVRRFDAAEGRLEIDVVLHPGGAASTWTSNARPGNHLHLAGPQLSTALPAVGLHLLAGDETALPAIARYLEERDGSIPAVVVVEVASAVEQQSLTSTADVELLWVRRDEGGSLAGAVADLDLADNDLFAWVAGEGEAVQAVRRHLLEDRALPGDRIDATRYWRGGRTNERLGELMSTLHELTDLLTPYAIRTAIELRLADAIAGGTTDVESLAAEVGADPAALSSLVHHLIALEVLTAPAPGQVGLAALGELLVGGGYRHLGLDSAPGHLSAAWAGLRHTVRTGESGYEAVFGQGFWDRLAADPPLEADFDTYLAEWAKQWVPLVAARWRWPTGTVVDVGGGTGTLLTSLLSAHPELTGILVERPAVAARAQARLAEAGVADRCSVVAGDLQAPLPSGGETYLLAQVLHDWPDGAAGDILRRAASAAGHDGRVVLVERIVDDDEPNTASDLRMRVLFGGSERTREQFEALAQAAGLRLVDVVPAGMGLSLLELIPAQAAG